MMLRKYFIANVAFVLALPLLGGCLEMGESESEAAADGNNDGGTAPTNQAPTISGSPSQEATVGANWSFTPNASDPDGDTLTFTVANLPAWASFNDSNGRVSGTPTAGTEGTYSGIRVTVSDGELSASTPAFAVEVTQVSMGAATLTWTPPTQNTDGSALTDLAGYRIYYGTSEGNYTESLDLDNPGLSTYIVDNLAPDTYYFVSTAVNVAGVESDFSNVAVVAVN